MAIMFGTDVDVAEQITIEHAGVLLDVKGIYNLRECFFEAVHIYLADHDVDIYNLLSAKTVSHIEDECYYAIIDDSEDADY